MKQIMESPEVFEAYAQIDLGYIALGMIEKKTTKPKAIIEQMIDDATGFSKAETKQDILDSVEIIENIIRCKKIIEAPFDKDETLLKKLKNIL